MIQQINNQSVRFKEKGASDIDYLKSFYNNSSLKISPA